MIEVRFRVALAAVIGWAFLPAAAQPAIGLDSDAPISVDADRIEALQNEDRVIATGNVIVAQGPALLTADRMVIDFIPGTQDFKRIEGEGRLRYASGEDALSGERGVYDALTGTLVVTGAVVAIQGEQVLTGDRLVYDMTSGAITFSAEPGQRVRGLFKPASQSGPQPGADKGAP